MARAFIPSYTFILYITALRPILLASRANDIKRGEGFYFGHRILLQLCKLKTTCNVNTMGLGGGVGVVSLYRPGLGFVCVYIIVKSLLLKLGGVKRLVLEFIE